jgi:tRNA 2-thiouridine synthesizing protein E
MLRVEVHMQGTNEPIKRTSVMIRFDETQQTIESMTDRTGVAEFDIEPASGKILVAGITRYQGRLDGTIEISLWSVTETSTVSEEGAPTGMSIGTTLYPGMKTRTLLVNGKEVLTDSEGYLVDLNDWSEDFVRAEAEFEGLKLTSEHWEVIRYLRDFYEQKNVQCTVRDMIKHFRKIWGADKGNNRYLHEIFPRGGPQKQGNRLAGLLRTKGEH